jgi:hypothetical protein
LLPNGPHDFWSEQGAERFGDVGPGAVFVEVDLLEQGLVEQAPGVVVSVQVGPVAIGCQVQSDGLVLFDLVELDLAGGSGSRGGCNTLTLQGWHEQ